MRWPSTQNAASYYHLDALGSVHVVTDQRGHEIERHDYLLFDEWAQSTFTLTLLFSGKQRDTESALDYFGARYYASRTGRFATADPLMGIELALADPQQWNRYSYVGNRLTRFVDPDGRGWASTLFKLGKAVVKREDIYSTVAGVVHDTSTVFSMDARVGTGDRLKATGSLVLGLSGVGDVIGDNAVQCVGIANNLTRRAAEHVATKGIEITSLKGLEASRVRTRARSNRR